MNNLRLSVCIALFVFLTGSTIVAFHRGRHMNNLAIGYLMVAIVLDELKGQGLFQGGAQIALVLRCVSVLIAAGLILMNPSRP